MITRIIDFLCGGSSKPIWDRVRYGPKSGYASQAQCPKCKSTKFEVYFSGGLQSLLCSECGWFSGVSMSGNKIANKAEIKNGKVIIHKYA